MEKERDVCVCVWAPHHYLPKTEKERNGELVAWPLLHSESFSVFRQSRKEEEDKETG